MLCVQVWLHDKLKQRDLVLEVKYLRVQTSHRTPSCLINESPSIKTFTEPRVTFKSPVGAQCGAFWVLF